MVYLILILAVLVRLFNLDQSIWLDEAITALAVKNNSLVELIFKFSPGDFHPPFYYIFLKIWTNIFGYSEIALRSPSVIFGVITIFFVYKMGGKKAAILMAVNPLAVYYSQEARMYSMTMMLITMAVYFFVNHKRYLFVFTFLTALYGDYVPWLMIPIFLSRELIPVILLLLPLAPLLLIQAGSILGVSGRAWGDVLGRASIKNLFLVPAKFIFGRISLPVGIYAIFTAAYTYLATSSRNRIYWAWLLIPLVLGFILSFKVPVFTYFRFLFVLPAFVLLISSGKTWQVVLVFLISIFSLGYFNLNQRFWREDWRSAVSYFNSDKGSVFMPSLAQGAPLKYYAPNLTVFDKNTTFVAGRTVYLLRYVQEIFDPQDTLRKTIESKGFNLTEQKNFNGVVVWKYWRI